MKKLLIVVTVAVLQTAVCHAGQWYVNGVSGSDANYGNDSLSAKKTIQSAIDVSSAGDTILVAPGTYSAIDTQGKDITIRSTGGAEATKIVGITNGGLKSDDEVTAALLISNEINGQVGDSEDSDEEGPFKYDVGDEWRTWTPADLPGSALEGFTVEVTGVSEDDQVGIIGGRVKNCRLICRDGVKRFNLVQLAVIENSLIVAGDLGVWIDEKGMEDGDVEVLSDCILRNCTVYTLSPICGSKMENTIVYGRWSGVYLDEGSNRPTLSNCVFYNVKGVSKRSGVTVADPLFVNAANGDFSLRSGSPCINKGGAAYGTTDLAGNPRVVNGKIDVGCYEYQSSTPDEEPSDFRLLVEKAAQVYDGCLYDADGAIAGTIQVKLAKAKIDKKTNAATSKASVSIQVAGEKKVTASGSMDVDGGALLLTAKDGRYLEAGIDESAFDGMFGDYEIRGARNLFSSKDKAEAASANNVADALKSRGAIAIVWDDAESGGRNVLSVSVMSKGKTKVSGTLANGTKVSVSTQMIVSEDECLVPVVYAKKGVSLSFGIRLSTDGGDVEVDGLGDDAVVGWASALNDGAAFSIDAMALAELLDDDTYLDYLPDGVSVEQKGTKWVIANGAKAGKVVVDRKTGEIDESKLGENPSGLKLAFKPKDGTFSGSFKAYVDVNGKPKATTVSVSGIVIDGVGYGVAVIRKVGSVSVWID